MAYRSHVAHYLEPFVADRLELELVLPDHRVAHTVQIELVLPDHVVPVPLEMTVDPAMIKVGGQAATPFPQIPTPRVRITPYAASNNIAMGWGVPYYYLPLQSIEAEDDVTKFGDVIVAVLAAREELYPPAGFEFQVGHLLEEGGDKLFIGVFTRRIQPGESVVWPGSYAYGYLYESDWLAYCLYNISGAIDPAAMTVEFEEHFETEFIENPTVIAAGELGIVALASRGAPNLNPTDPNFTADADDLELSLPAYLGVSRAAPFLGSVGPGATWVSAGNMVRSIAMTLVISASPRLDDDGAEAPAGVRVPIG